MNPRLIVLAGLLLVVSFLSGCGKKEAETAEAAFEPVAAHIRPVEILSERKPITVYGIVQPARQSFVSGRAVGPVVEVKVEAGQTVRAGQPLVLIQPRMIEGQVAQAEGAQAQAEAALALAKKNYDRYRRLHEKKAASDLELDMARMQYEQALGAVSQARGAVETASAVADDAVVRAPFDARVVDKLVEVGDLAAPGRPLVRLESVGGGKIWITVREADIRRVAKGDRLEVRFNTRPDLGTVKGAVDEIVPAADPATHTFTVKVLLPGVQVRSGVSGTAQLPGNVTERLVTLRSAVHRRGGLELVVVRDAGGKARTRAVTTGGLVPGGRVEILSGLSRDDQVLVDAPGPLPDGTPVEAVP